MMERKRARTPAMLSWTIVISVLAIEGMMVLGWYPERVPDIVIGRILGTLDLALGLVLNYWLGNAYREPYPKPSEVAKSPEQG